MTSLLAMQFGNFCSNSDDVSKNNTNIYSVGLLYAISVLSFFLSFFLFFFLIWANFKVILLNLLQYCFCFTFWCFGHKADRILAPASGIRLAFPALEGEMLTIGLPGKSPGSVLNT